ncbi:MAG: chemotaxis protein CheW [Acidobacteria bacterium]|nr:chemotaxis protein CheW [Acidobacteriota bacterium]
MATDLSLEPRGARELFVVRARGRLFAVFAEEVEATAEGLAPAPLPGAPPAVVGVVSLRGRIRTALDPAQLLPDDQPTQTRATPPADQPNARDSSGTRDADARTAPRLFVALRGDEQLALACDSADGRIEIAPAEIVPPTDAHTPSRGTVERGGSRVTVLDTALLFDAATRGTERRRKRS